MNWLLMNRGNWRKPAGSLLILVYWSSILGLLSKHPSLCRFASLSSRGEREMSQPRRLGAFATIVLWAFAVSPTMLFSQESDRNSSSSSSAQWGSPLASPQMPAPTAQSASYQWVLSGPFYRTDWVPYHLRRCWGYQLCYQQVSVPYYAYVLTQVGERRGAIPPGPDTQLPIPAHESPYVGNPGPGSVR